MFSLSTIDSLLFSLAFSSPLPADTSVMNNAGLRTIYTFPNNTFVENLAARSNGNLLVTLITPSPDIWEIHPFDETARRIYTFPDALSVLGIAEYAPDVFAVNVGNFSTTTGEGTKGSFSVWSVDMNGCDIAERQGHAAAQVQKLADIPSATLLNGMAALPANPSTLLTADSVSGAIYALDTTTGMYQVAIEPNRALTPAPAAAIEIGVNGLQFRPEEPDTLYFTNSFRNGHFGRVSIDSVTGIQAGPAEILFRRKTISPQDDFTFDAAGNAWVTGSPQDTVARLEGTGWDFEVVVHDTDAIAGPTSCKFGRTEGDAGVLYVSTNGGLVETLPQGIRGGAVVAVDTAKLS